MLRVVFLFNLKTSSFSVYFSCSYADLMTCVMGSMNWLGFFSFKKYWFHFSIASFEIKNSPYYYYYYYYFLLSNLVLMTWVADFTCLPRFIGFVFLDLFFIFILLFLFNIWLIGIELSNLFWFSFYKFITI
jgi:hypothetical protein